MKTIITKHEFRDAFGKAGRKDQFTYEGLGALFDSLEEYEESTGGEIELDVIAICCDFSEFTNLDECINEYNYHGKADKDSKLEWLQDRTTVIEMENGGIIIQAF